MKEIDSQFFDTVKHPDHINRISISNTITFIYDPQKDILYAEPAPSFHKDIRKNTPELQHLNNNQETISNGLLLGRTGILPNKTKVISFWNVHFKRMDLLANCLNSIIKKYPVFNDPNTVVMTDQNSKFDPYKHTFNGVLLKDFSGVHVSNVSQEAPEEKHQPGCNTTLDILGVPTSLSDILGNFHMVKDNRLPAMITAVCSQGPALKQELAKKSCTMQVSMIDQLLDKANCKQAGEYNALKQGGRIARKQELQKIFADPELTSRTFRTQRELDAAWDELQGRNEHRMTGFTEWINRYSHEV